MPVASSQVDALKTFIGQGEVFNRVTPPTNGSPANPLSLVVSSGSVLGVVPAGTGPGSLAISVGLTSGPTSLQYKPDFKGVEVEQALGEVAPRTMKEAVTLKFKCAEATYNRMRIAIQNGTAVTTGPVNTVYKHFLTVGGLTFPPFAGGQSLDCVAVVSKITGPNGGVDRYEWVCIYQAASISGLKLDWKRGETRMVEVEITGYADVTRNEGDQLFQIGQEDLHSGTGGDTAFLW